MSDPDMVNPYAAPKAFGSSAPTLPNGRYEVRGKQMAIRDGAVLPPRCVKTNQEVIPGENGRIKKVKLGWISPWWILLLFVPFGLLVLIIVSLTNTSRGTVTVHLSKDAIRKKRIIIASILFVSLGPLFLLPVIAGRAEELIPLIGLGSLIGLIVMLFCRRYLAVKGFKKGWFLVGGFNKEFLREISTG